MLILDLLEVLFMPRLAGRSLVVVSKFMRHVNRFDVSIAAASPGVRPGFSVQAKFFSSLSPHLVGKQL